MGSCSLLQGTFTTQGSNSGLLHCRWILYQLSYQGWFTIRTVPLTLLFSNTMLAFLKAAIVIHALRASCFFDDPADVGNLISGSSAQLEHQEVHGSRIAEAWLGEF